MCGNSSGSWRRRGRPFSERVVGVGALTTRRFVSPERRWRAGASVLLAGWVAWRLLVRPLPMAGSVAGWVIAAALVVLAALTLRTHLVADEFGVTDHRVFRVVRVPWARIEDFVVARPGGLWGGFCVVALCPGDSKVDLLATRVYSRIPSAKHMDEAERVASCLQEMRPVQPQEPGST
jgi:hypothetical protein